MTCAFVGHMGAFEWFGGAESPWEHFRLDDLGVRVFRARRSVIALPCVTSDSILRVRASEVEHSSLNAMGMPRWEQSSGLSTEHGAQHGALST